MKPRWFRVEIDPIYLPAGLYGYIFTPSIDCRAVLLVFDTA